MTTGAISRAKLQSNHHHQQTNIQFLYRPDALPVAQPTVSKHCRENIKFHGLAYPTLTWGLPTLSLTTNSSWLPWGRVAMPLLSPLMPVPQCQSTVGNKHETTNLGFRLRTTKRQQEVSLVLCRQNRVIITIGNSSRSFSCNFQPLPLFNLTAIRNVT